MKLLITLTSLSVLFLAWSILRLLDSSDCLESNNIQNVVYAEKKLVETYSQCSHTRIYGFKTIPPESLELVKHVSRTLDEFEHIYLSTLSQIDVLPQTLIIYKNLNSYTNFSDEYIHLSSDFLTDHNSLFSTILKARIIRNNPDLAFNKDILSLTSQFYRYLIKDPLLKKDISLKANIVIKYYIQLSANDKIHFIKQMNAFVSPNSGVYLFSENYNEQNIKSIKNEMERFLTAVYNGQLTQSKKQKLYSSVFNLTAHLKPHKSAAIIRTLNQKQLKISTNNKLKSEHLIYLNCMPPSLNDILKLKPIHLKPYWIKNCGEKAFQKDFDLLTRRPELFLKKYSQLKFIKFHIPSIIIANRYYKLNLDTPLSSVKFGQQLKWVSFKEDQEHLAQIPIANIEAITHFRGI